MGKILVIHGSDFSQNRIDKVTIVEKPKYLDISQYPKLLKTREDYEFIRKN